MSKDILDQIEDIKTSLANELEDLHNKKDLLVQRLVELKKEIPKLQTSLTATTKIFGFKSVNKNKKNVLEIAEVLKKAVEEYDTKENEHIEVLQAISILEESLWIQILNRELFKNCKNYEKYSEKIWKVLSKLED